MCELLAIVSNRRVGFGLSWAGLQMGAARNPDGWGAGWLYEERFKVKKRAERIPAGRVGRALVQGVRSDTFIGHIRFKVQGERTLANTQPFIGDDRRSVFAGTIQSCLGRRGLRARVRPRLNGETGPEALYHLLLTAYEDQGLQGIRDGRRGVRALSGFEQRECQFCFVHRWSGPDLSASKADVFAAASPLTPTVSIYAARNTTA